MLTVQGYKFISAGFIRYMHYCRHLYEYMINVSFNWMLDNMRLIVMDCIALFTSTYLVDKKIYTFGNRIYISTYVYNIASILP